MLFDFRGSCWFRLRSLLLAQVVLVLVLFYLLGFDHDFSQSGSLKLWSFKSGSSHHGVDSSGGLPWPKAPERLWSTLQPLLDGNAPGNQSLQGVKDWGVPRFNPNSQVMAVQDHIGLSASDTLRMRDMHRNFVREIDLKLPYHLPTKDAPKRGIVTVAGDYHFPIFFVSLRMLRRTGSTLPVEVFLPNEDAYEEEICESILPQFNARCITLTSIVNHGNGTYKMTKELAGYQYKIFSILFSSFEEVLFLDSDSFPIQNPDGLFDSKPFKETGLITWPDIWATSVSPLYYLISSQDLASVSERASMESGQMVISKVRHHRSMVLAAYYNYFGPGLYYDLLCQAGYGKGDKETFQPAATALGLPFYAVSEPLKSVGHPQAHSPEYYTFAMIQHDPMEDFDHIRGGPKAEKPRPFFLHANTPKWNPKTILDGGPPWIFTKDLDGKESAAYTGPEDGLREIPWVEQQLWEEAIWVGCELETKLKDFEQTPRTICKRLREYARDVLSSRYGVNYT